MPTLPDEASIVRLVGAVLLKANDEWQLQHRYLSIEAFASVNTVVNAGIKLGHFPV